MYQLNIYNGSWVPTNEFSYVCGGYSNNFQCQQAIQSTNFSCGTGMVTEVQNAMVNQTDCAFECTLSVNSSGTCSSSCPAYTYNSTFFGQCLYCESVAFDGGIIWSRSSQTCINTACKYIYNQTATSWNLSISYILTCEDVADPVNATTYPWCAYFNYLNTTSFICVYTCPSYYYGRYCNTSCWQQYPVVPTYGSYACQANCSSNIYYVNNSVNICNTTCALPWGLGNATLYFTGAYLCYPCSPVIIQRSSGSCISSCSTINSTTANSTSVTICENVGDSTNCPYRQYLNSSAYTCNSTCGVVIVGNICCPIAAPLVASSGS